MPHQNVNTEAALPSKQTTCAIPMAAEVVINTGCPTSKLEISFHSRLGLVRAQKLARSGKPNKRETHPAQLGSAPNTQRRPAITDTSKDKAFETMAFFYHV